MLLLMANASGRLLKPLSVTGEGRFERGEVVPSLREPVSNDGDALFHNGSQRPYGRRDDHVGCHAVC